MTYRRFLNSSCRRALAELCVVMFGLSALIGSGGGGGGGDENIDPVADAGSAQTVDARTDVTLNGSGSRDPDGSITRFQWVQTSGPDVILNNATTATPSFTAPNLAGSILLVFRLTVTDNDGATDSTTVSITVLGVVTFEISGFIAAPSVVAVDSDTNDPFAPYEPNDTPNQAQTISNPITLGGYVNVAGNGAPGRSQLSGDLDDYYRVRLLAGQVITMLVSDFQTGDADLYLYDSTGQFIVDASIDIGEIESIVVPADGDYFVNPYAFTGASNYVLVIGNTGIGSTRGTLRLSDEFVPGQAVMRYDNKTGKSRGQSVDAMSSAAGFSIRAGAPDRPMLLALDRPTGATVALKSATGSGAIGQKALSLRNEAERAKWETLMAIKALRKDPAVDYAEPNYILEATVLPNDEAYVAQGHYPLINLPAAWDLTTGSPGVVVAVIDTGALLNHPDLQGQFVTGFGYDFISSSSAAGDGTGIDSNPSDPGDGGSSQSSSFHGTHVAGTIAAASNTNGTGVAGVAWNVKIMVLRALGIGGGTTYDIGQAVLYAAGLPNDSNTFPAQRADVMNLSLGGSFFSQASQDIFTAARNAGVVIVAAAGNESSSQFSYPASYNGVISVSAVDSVRQLAPYSNFGTRIDVAAPGGDMRFDRNGDGYPDGVLSTGGNDSTGSISYVYPFLQGTSMASPHVAGVIALMKSVNGNLTPAMIDQELTLGTLTDDIGLPGRDNSFGHGLINAHKAVTRALNLGGTSPPDTPFLSVSPASLNFDAATTAIEISLQNVGTGNLQIVSLTPDAAWISVTPTANVANNGLGSYVVSVNRGGLADGIYSGQITAESDVNTVNISIVMSVGDIGIGGNVGFIYLLLIDSETGDVVDAIAPSPTAGIYPYTFTNVVPGTYELVAGTDADNDFFICDPGEACGAYLTLDQPIQLSVTGNLSNLDFSIGYVVALPSVTATDKTTGPPASGLPRADKQASRALAR